MAVLVYALCAMTSFACMVLLLKAYSASRVKLLLWSGLCFAGLTLNNVLLFIDVRIVPEYDLSVWRTIPAVVGVGLLIYGLIWDSE